MTETTAEYDETQYDPHADPQWSEDGHYWWDGATWITAAEREAQLEQASQEESARVEAARESAEQAREERAHAAQEKSTRVLTARAEAQAQREAAAAQREAEREARAQAAQAKAPQEAPRTTTTLPDERSSVRLWTRVVLALVLVLVVLAGFLVALLHKKAAPATPAAAGGSVGSTLLDARDAEQKFHDAHARYTGSILELTPLGFRPAKGVTLTVVRADAGTYCLSGSKGADAFYLSSADLTISRTPCS